MLMLIPEQKQRAGVIIQNKAQSGELVKTRERDGLRKLMLNVREKEWLLYLCLVLIISIRDWNDRMWKRTVHSTEYSKQRVNSYLLIKSTTLQL